MKNAICYIKLVNGENLIAEVDRKYSKGTNRVILNVFRIIPGRTEDGAASSYMYPWNIFNNDPVTIDAMHIITIIDNLPDWTLKYYQSAVDTFFNGKVPENYGELDDPDMENGDYSDASNVVSGYEDAPEEYEDPIADSEYPVREDETVDEFLKRGFENWNPLAPGANTTKQ